MNGAADGPTIASILTEDQGDEAIRGAMRDGDAAGALDRRLEVVPPALRTLARDEVVAVVLSALDLPLANVLAAGWKRYEELVDAATRSLEEPGETELVELRDRRIVSTHRPRIDVTLNGEEIAHIELELELEIVLHTVTAVVRAGRLSALRTGRADATARLSVEGQQVAEKTRAVELPIEIGLGAGIPLATAADVVVLPPSPAEEPTLPH